MNPTSHDAKRTDGPVPARVFEMGDVNYPSGLRGLPTPPTTVFMIGSMIERDKGAIAVVGSRRASSIAVDEAFGIGRRLAERRVTVVSGLALGVDSAAHRGALSVPAGRTIAVVATGLDITFPSENTSLDNLIRQRGVVMSRVEPGVPASRDSLLARNELVAALAIASVVVVADEFSGTRNEIGHTIAQRKPVVFWEPTMGRAAWALELVTAGLGFFADEVDNLMERLGKLREAQP